MTATNASQEPTVLLMTSLNTCPASWDVASEGRLLANHSDPRTTKLYDRRKDLATLSEIERRIAFE
jgi:hypothetical protein